MVYGHGGDIYTHLEKGKKMLDFSANINPLGLPPAVERALRDAAADCIVYPDPFCRALRKKIAEYERTSSDAVVCGNGAADLIDRIAYGLRPSSVLVTAPTFSEYEQAAARSGSRVFYHTLNEKDEFVLGADFLQSLRERKPQLAFLCNPNNPTGKLIPKELLLKIAELCNELQIILVIDECFLSFVPGSEQLTMVPLLEQFTNLIILKAFTKFFAMPGLRLGYLLAADERIRERILGAGQPWNVSSVAQKCGIAALEDRDYIAQTKQLIPALKNDLYRELALLPLRIYRSEANYLLLRTDAADLDKQMEQQGILIRSCANYHGLTDGYYRVAVKSGEKNRRLVKALKLVLTEKK